MKIIPLVNAPCVDSITINNRDTRHFRKCPQMGTLENETRKNYSFKDLKEVKMLKKVLYVVAALVVATGLLLGGVAIGRQSASTPATAAPTLTPTPGAIQPTAATTVTTTEPEEVRYNEPLTGSLDDFGRIVRYDDRFPPGGMIWDQSYNTGEILVLNAYALHDHEFRSQNGCVVGYFIGPGRVRFTAFDGQAFELNAGVISLNQAIAAMRETLTRAHGCLIIQYHQLIKHGEAIK